LVQNSGHLQKGEVLELTGTQTGPKKLKGLLPSSEELEAELSKMDRSNNKGPNESDGDAQNVGVRDR
jgi:hypothetical protein